MGLNVHHQLSTIDQIVANPLGDARARALNGPPFVARLNQAEVELVAIGNLPWTNPVCWLPNGAPSNEPFPTRNCNVSQWSADNEIRKVAFYIRNESAEGISSPVCRVSKESGAQPASSCWAVPDQPTPNGYLGQIIVCPSNAATMNISVGIANGPWETAVSVHSGLGGGASSGGDWSASYQAVSGKSSEVAVSCTYTKNEDWESRMVCVAADGKLTVIPEISAHAAKLPTTSGLLMFSSDAFEHIKEFQLQRRKYQWAEFRNVSLQPGHRTTVTVKDSGGGIQSTPPMSASSAAAPELSFGPVIERVVNDLNVNNQNVAIRFQTGELLSLPPVDRIGQQMWMLTNGLALLVTKETGHWILTAGGLRLGDIPAERWEKANAAEVTESLQYGTRLTHPEHIELAEVSYLLPEPLNLPFVLSIQTREGAIGLLQLTGFTENPRGVKLRYKLVQSDGASARFQGEPAIGLDWPTNAASRSQFSDFLFKSAIREYVNQRNTNALKIYDFMFQAFPELKQDPGQQLQLAHILNSSGHARGALEIISQIETNGSDYVKEYPGLVWLAKGNALRQLGRYGDAMIAYSNIVIWTTNGHQWFSSYLFTVTNSMRDLEAKQFFQKEPPKLQFLAWQDEWETNQPGAARHPDGSPVTAATELKWLDVVSAGGMDVSSLKLSPEPRFLKLWFSHPAFDGNSLGEITLLDDQNQAIPLAAGGSLSCSQQEANENDGNLGWQVETLSPGAGTNIPPRVTVRLRYTAGPLENTQDVPVTPNSSTVMSLEGGSQLNGVGQNVDGNAFVAIAVDAGKLKQRKFGALVVTKDGRELKASGGSTGGISGGSGVRVESFVFDVPLADVVKFIIGTRPIRTVEFTNVVLPGNRQQP